MTKSLEQVKTPASRTFEFILLIVTLCVLAIRATYPESPNTNSIVTGPVLDNAAFSLLITSVLVLCFAAWLIYALLNGKVRYRFNWIEVGTFIFIAAGIASVFIASNKRFAITELVTIAGPMLAAIMLVQILDNDFRIKLVMITIVACAMVTVLKCSDDFFTYNQMMIQQYEENPRAMLNQLGIEEGTFQQFSYEHRLYSKDVRGFLTTGNSVASFMIMAIFASIAIYCKRIGKNSMTIIIPLILISSACFGMVLSHSKGGFAAFAVSLFMLTIYLLFGNLLKRFRTPLLVISIIAAACIITLTVNYGIRHDRLPGGNSMLVRWQYWAGAMKVYALKPFTGVGGGNFGNWYLHFKQPDALESVKDPHNFLLSILSQYGPLALIGFCAAFIMPMLRQIFPGKPGNLELSEPKKIITPGLLTAISISAAMLIFRPILMHVDYQQNDLSVIFATFLLLFGTPAIIFFIAFAAMTFTELKLKQTRLSEKTTAFLFCALVAIVLHNLIDFAFFEPAISTMFWSLTACMVACRLNKTQTTAPVPKVSTPLRIGAVLATIACTYLFFHFAVIPPVRASSLKEQALDKKLSYEKLTAAANADPLSADIPALYGKMLLSHFQSTKNPELLVHAVKHFTQAKDNDPANFANYEKLSQTHGMLASVTKGPAAKENTEKAAYWLDEAIKRYPNSDRLHFQAAELAEDIGNPQKALEHYRKVIQIEDAYREIFKVMYPDTDIFSRLGEEKYQQAKQKVNELKP